MEHYSDNPDLGPFLLKSARDAIGENPNKALDYSIRAADSFQKVPGRILELVMSWHVVAAINCSLGKFDESVRVLERAIAVPGLGDAPDHALAKFSGYMQLGYCYSMNQLTRAIDSYQSGLKIQVDALGNSDPRVAEACRTGKHRESQSNCENALRIYTNAVPGTTSEEIANGLTEMSAIYEAMDEPEEALKISQLALESLADTPRNRSSIAGIEGQADVIFYIIGRYQEARTSFGSAIRKIRATGERKSAFFGILLNQMGLVCVLFKIDEATKLFEEAMEIPEEEYGSWHLDTLGVYSNLAATYNAVGRVEDAIVILEYRLKVREEKLGTANPDMDDEKRRLSDLPKEAGRARNRRAEEGIPL